MASIKEMKNYPLCVWVASLCGLGFIPSGMPGTVSSFAACVVSVFVDVPLWAIILNRKNPGIIKLFGNK